jgi:hypothetical protein
MFQVILVHMVQVTSRSIMVQDTTQCTWFRILQSPHGSIYSWELMIQGTQEHIIQVTPRSLWFRIPFVQKIQVTPRLLLLSSGYSKWFRLLIETHGSG